MVEVDEDAGLVERAVRGDHTGTIHAVNADLLRLLKQLERRAGRGEVLPYVVGRSANVPGDESDPFFDPHAVDGRVGADATLRVTSNLTLNATVNPDFGQVEVDPAVVNLSAFETFFDEKRPFFVEGAGYFGLGGLNCFFC